MDWKQELKEQLGATDENAAAGLEDMEGYEVLGEQHLIRLKGSPPAGRDISNGFFQAVRELNLQPETSQTEEPVYTEEMM